MEIINPEPQLPDWAKNAVNLANARLGAQAIFATDNFFAPMERMLNPQPAVFIPGKFDNHGKWMDGWETRRRRTTGYDWGIIQLARPGVIQGFHFDTSHFTGNYAPAVSVDACFTTQNDLQQIIKSQWVEIFSAVSLEGNSHKLVPLPLEHQKTIFSHLRVNLFPDGGLARFRVYGHPKLQTSDQKIDLLALENGGRAIAWNDAHYGVPQNMILPGKGLNMGDGWETRRRREPGSDWCLFQLAAKGKVEEIEVDTAFFKGNYPDFCSIQAACVEGGTDQSCITQSMFWPYLLLEQKLEMDRVFLFQKEIQPHLPITHIRFNILPDGGVSRLRLWGKLAPPF